MKRLRIKPSTFVLIVGVLVMLGAFASGIVPRITKWHDDSPVAREVFVNIPDPLYWAFYITVPIMLFMTASAFWMGTPRNASTVVVHVFTRSRGVYWIRVSGTPVNQM